MEEFNSKQKDVALYPFGQNSCALSTWIERMKYVHLDRVHVLYPHGQSSCTLSMWTEYMNSVHVDINYQMIHVGNSTYLEEETNKCITTFASSRFYV